MRLGRRLVLAGAGLVGAELVLARTAAAAPAVHRERRLTMLLGLPEGSKPDRMAREFLAFLAMRLPGCAVDVRNLPGDGGRTMLAALGAAGATDGVFGWVSTPTLAARVIDRGDPSLMQRLMLLGQIAREPIAFVSLASDPAETVQDIIRRSAEDWDAVPLGTPAAGSPPFLAALRLQGLAQTRLNIITFPSSEAALRAVLAGNVSAAALGLSRAIGEIRDGDLHAIGIAARRRFGLLPDTPVLDEGGIPLSAFIRRGLAVPAGTPAGFAAMLVDAARAVTDDDEFRRKAEADGYYTAWQDGATWLEAAEAERTMLAALWSTDPWLCSSGE
ncbi:MAG TPA: tripartite tricarboxylate transporter substrate-binding protein [Rhodopila sp.]|nr:tripartite tricarboxylate transporter substrate-binding protein [Rhodopila sp.]